ncbi:MAG TPA: hypothetical protein VM096_12410 [Vicinamibacterales bacterium]|nr:hypothetical protein [Vicinamibacterales bacterium]
MDIILLGVTIVSLVVALVMSVAAWRLMREEKQRSAARVAALSTAANEPAFVTRPAGFAQTLAPSATLEQFADEPAVKTLPRAPWSAPRPAAAAAVSMPAEFSSPPLDSTPSAHAKSVSLRTESASFAPAELPLNQQGRVEAMKTSEPSSSVVTHSSGFLGASEMERDKGGRQKTIAFAAIVLFLVMSGGLAWMMSGPRGSTAAAVGPNSPLELVSLTHARQNDKLSVSGLVRNPANGKTIDHLSAVVFLFDRTGTFVTSSRANVDFLKLGAGDESPFVVSLDAPATVARYRVSFRTDDGIVPHIDRRSASPAPVEGEQAVNTTAK